MKFLNSKVRVKGKRAIKRITNVVFHFEAIKQEELFFRMITKVGAKSE
jgi:hypothetical protein